MYSFKDILIGYRLEYQKIKKELESLEKHIKILDDNLKTCLPLLSNNQELSLYFIDGKRYAMDTIMSIKENSGILVYELQNLDWDKTIDLVYHLQNTKHQYHILIQFVEEFTKKVLTILNMKYTKYVQGQYVSNDNKLLTIDYNKITLEEDTKEFNYYPHPDKYIISSPDYDGSKELDYYLSAMFFPKEQFNYYQQELIEESKGKELIFKN